MHYARMNSPGEKGYRHLGPNRARTKPVFSVLYFHFQILKNDQINDCQCILYTFTMILNSMSYIQYILVMVYTNIYANKGFVRDYLAVNQHVSGCIWRNLTATSQSSLCP